MLRLGLCPSSKACGRAGWRGEERDEVQLKVAERGVQGGDWVPAQTHAPWSPGLDRPLCTPAACRLGGCGRLPPSLIAARPPGPLSRQDKKC